MARDSANPATLQPTRGSKVGGVCGEGFQWGKGYTAREVSLTDRNNLHRTSLQDELVWGWKGVSVVKELATQL